MRTQNESDTYLFNIIFSAMGMVLMGVAGWIAVSVAHLPAIEQKLDDYIISADNKLADLNQRVGKLESFK